jgi:hypothetical protein
MISKSKIELHAEPNKFPFYFFYSCSQYLIQKLIEQEK